MPTVSISNILKISAVGAVLLFNTACGNTSWVTNASLTTYTQNQDTYGKIAVDLGTAGLLFPSMSVAILDPHNPSTIIGAVSLVGGLGSAKAQLAVDLDLTKVASLPKFGASPVLPNGAPIPVAGIDTQNLLVFNVGGNKTQVYVDMNPAAKQGLFGVAIPIAQFDSIGKATLGLVNIMPSFTLGNGIMGTAGIFTGALPGQSGFALFLDISGLLQGVQTLSVARASLQTVRPHVFMSLSQGSSWKQMTVLSQISDLSSRRVQLRPAR